MALNLFGPISHPPSQTVAWRLSPSSSYLSRGKLWDVMPRRGQHVLPPHSAPRWAGKHLRVLQSQHISEEKWPEPSRCPSHDRTTFCVRFTSAPELLQKQLLLEAGIIIISHPTQHVRGLTRCLQKVSPRTRFPYLAQASLSFYSPLAMSACCSLYPMWWDSNCRHICHLLLNKYRSSLHVYMTRNLLHRDKMKCRPPRKEDIPRGNTEFIIEASTSCTTQRLSNQVWQYKIN